MAVRPSSENCAPMSAPLSSDATRLWHRTGPPILVLRGLGQGLEFAAFVLFARRLGAAEFGRLSVAFLACRYAGLVADWGASIRGARDVAIARHRRAVPGLGRRRHPVTLGLAGASPGVVGGVGLWSRAPL